MEIVFHGVRGSVPVGSPLMDRYGGSTTCLSMRLDPTSHLVLDCGTGLRGLEDHIGSDDRHFTVLLSHYHWDHLMGLPFFSPMFEPEVTFDFYGSPWETHTVEEGVAGAFEPPWFPVPLSDTAAHKNYLAVPDEPWQVGPLTLSAARLHHPQGVTAYRIDTPTGSVVFATDVERGEKDSDERLAKLARGADVLIHDAQYSPDDYDDHRGWGHSTWEDAVAAAEDAGVTQLILVSHDPQRTDVDVDRLLEEARKRFPDTDAARVGMAIDI